MDVFLGHLPAQHIGILQGGHRRGREGGLAGVTATAAAVSISQLQAELSSVNVDAVSQLSQTGGVHWTSNPAAGRGTISVRHGQSAAHD